MVLCVILSGLRKLDINREAEDMHNLCFEVSCQDRVQYYDNGAKKTHTYQAVQLDLQTVLKQCISVLIII